MPIIDLVANFYQSVSFVVNNNNGTIEILSGCDHTNTNAVVFYSKNNKISTSSKPREIKYLTVKDLVKKWDIVIEHIRTEFMRVDPLTKGLKPIMFKEHVVNMGVIKSFDSLV